MAELNENTLTPSVGGRPYGVLGRVLGHSYTPGNLSRACRSLTTGALNASPMRSKRSCAARSGKA